jgi:hypothetical protein
MIYAIFLVHVFERIRRARIVVAFASPYSRNSVLFNLYARRLVYAAALTIFHGFGKTHLPPSVLS